MDNKSSALYKQCSSEEFLDARLFVFPLDLCQNYDQLAGMYLLRSPTELVRCRTVLTAHAKDSRGSVGDIANYKRLIVNSKL